MRSPFPHSICGVSIYLKFEFDLHSFLLSLQQAQAFFSWSIAPHIVLNAKKHSIFPIYGYLIDYFMKTDYLFINFMNSSSLPNRTWIFRFIWLSCYQTWTFWFIGPSCSVFFKGYISTLFPIPPSLPVGINWCEIGSPFSSGSLLARFTPFICLGSPFFSRVGEFLAHLPPAAPCKRVK